MYLDTIDVQLESSSIPTAVGGGMDCGQPSLPSDIMIACRRYTGIPLVV